MYVWMETMRRSVDSGGWLVVVRYNFLQNAILRATGSYGLKYFAEIHLSIVFEHKVDTNMYCSKHDQQSRNWLYALVFNSITTKLVNV